MTFTTRGRALKSLLLSALFMSIISLQAQQLQVLLDPVNPFQKNSLFNLSLLNGSNYSGQVNLKATLKSRRGKVLMIQEHTTNISTNESKSIRGTAVQATTSYTDPAFNELYANNNQLPPLNYILCVEALAIGDLGTRVEECTDYQASDFINVNAVYPPSDETIYDPRPQFNWINLDINQAYNYDLKLVEKEDKQNPNAALRRNNPIVIVENLSSNQYQYPSDAQPLENNKTYVWQLNINYNGETVSRTEPTSFTYKEEEQYIDIPRNLSYVDITELESGATLYAVGQFKFKFPTTTKTTLKASLFQVKKDGSRKELELENNKFEAQAGVNKYELDLKEQVYLKHLKTYELQLNDENKQKSYQFIIQYVNPDYIK